MKYLLIADDYLPNSTRICGKMMHDLACEFNSMGHSIVVITPGNKNQKNSLDKIILDDISVWRFKSGKIKDTNRLNRLINETILSTKALNACRSELKKINIDGIIYYSPSIFFGNLVCQLKKDLLCKSYLVLRDSFPQWAVDEGIIKEKSLIAHYLRYFEKRNYQAADYIGLMSKNNLKQFSIKHGNNYQIEVLPNWLRINKKHKTTKKWRKKLNLLNKIIFFYGGNMGTAQDMDSLIRLAKSLRTNQKAHFLFVGSGELFNNIKQQTKDFENLTLMESLPQNEFNDLMSEVDIGLFSLSKKHTSHNYPGKIMGYCSHRIPILGCVNKDNDLIGLVEEYQAGYVTDTDADAFLYEKSKILIESKEKRHKLGRNSHKMLMKYFSTTSAAEKIMARLSQDKEKINQKTFDHIL